VSAATWFYQHGESPVGPFSEAQLAAMLAARVVTRETPVRAHDAETWRPLADLFAFARATPPPLPAGTQNVAPPAGTWSDTAPHPWRRYIGRMFDIALMGTLTWMLIGLIYGAIDTVGATRMFGETNRFSMLFEALLGIPLSMIWSAIFLSLTGGTPGKWFAGVRILDANGRPPSLFVAFEREAMVWIRGLGLGIPLVSFVTLLINYTDLDKHSSTWWDKRLNLVATHRPEGGLQTTLIVIALVSWMAVNITFRLMLLR
jgi:uncharacterized RDD family membrane protein YckC